MIVTIISRYVSLGSLVMMTGFLVEFIIFAVNGMIPVSYTHLKQIEDAVNRFNDAVKNSSWQEIENILKDENGNYKSFDELTQDDLKAIVEAVVDIMKKANDMSQAAADVRDGINKINDILKPYFTNAGETMRNDIENAANEIQNAVNYANNAINGIKSIFTYLNAQSDIRFTRLSDDFDTHRNELYAEIKNISSGLSKFNDDMSSQSDVVNKDFQDINDKINAILDLMLDKIEAYMKLDVEPLYNDVSDEEIDEQTTGRVEDVYKRQCKARRAKLFYLRDRVGKAAKVKELVK